MLSHNNGGGAGQSGLSAVSFASGFRLVFQFDVVVLPRIRTLIIPRIQHLRRGQRRGVDVRAASQQQVRGCSAPQQRFDVTCRSVLLNITVGWRRILRPIAYLLKPSSAFVLMTILAAHRFRRAAHHTSGALRTAGSAPSLAQGEINHSARRRRHFRTRNRRQVAPPWHSLPPWSTASLGKGLFAHRTTQ